MACVEQVVEDRLGKLHEDNLVGDTGGEARLAFLFGAGFDHEEGLELDVGLRWWLNGNNDVLSAGLVDEQKVSAIREIFHSRPKHRLSQQMRSN